MPNCDYAGCKAQATHTLEVLVQCGEDVEYSARPMCEEHAAECAAFTENDDVSCIITEGVDTEDVDA